MLAMERSRTVLVLRVTTIIELLLMAVIELEPVNLAELRVLGVLRVLVEVLLVLLQVGNHLLLLLQELVSLSRLIQFGGVKLLKAFLFL